MAFEPLEFTKNWENSEDFPTYEPDEAQVRADLQWLHNETRDGLNRLIAALNDSGAASQLPFAPEAGLTAQTIQTAILEVYAAVRDAAAGLLVDGTITKEKLAQALLERVYGGKVWVSLDTPGAEQNPDTDFPVGQLWLRPRFEVENLAAEQWLLTGCTAQAEQDGWLLTTDGTLDTVSAAQLLENIGQPGEKIWVQLEVTELDDHLSELSLYLNSVEHDLMDGGGVFETALDQTGSLELMIWGAWPYAETDASVRLTGLTVVNSDAVEKAHTGCLPLGDWPDFLRTHGPFDRVSLPRTLYTQEAPGRWVEVSHTVLPVSRGGTGLSAVEKGQLLYADGTDSLAALQSPAVECLLTHDGTRPVWKTGEQVVEAQGTLRVATGTYTGNKTARTIALPVAPRLLHLYPKTTTTSMYDDEKLWDLSATLADGSEAGHRRLAPAGEDGMNYYYRSRVKLSGKQLIFSCLNPSVGPPDYMNDSGVTYQWVALY